MGGRTRARANAAATIARRAAPPRDAHPVDAHPQRRSVRRDDAEEEREGGREGAEERERGGGSVCGRGGGWQRGRKERESVDKRERVQTQQRRSRAALHHHPRDAQTVDAHPQRRSVRRDDAEEGREGGREGAAERECGGSSVCVEWEEGGRGRKEREWVDTYVQHVQRESRPHLARATLHRESSSVKRSFARQRMQHM